MQGLKKKDAQQVPGITERRVVRFALAGILLSVLTSMTMARAADAPRLNVLTGEKLAGELSDGTRITQGHIASQDAHAGFQVWSEAMKSGAQPNRYVLTGEQNSTNKLRVRIERDGWHADNSAAGQGIVINTSDDAAGFDVVVDGNQKVVSDRYMLDIRGAALVVNAAGQPEAGPVSVDTTGLNLISTVAVQHALNVVAGKLSRHQTDGTLLARGVVSAVDASGHRMAVRFASSTGQQQSDISKVSVPGENNPENTLKVRLVSSADITEREGWLVSEVNQPVFSYEIKTDGVQDVPPDTYKVSVDATQWGN